MSANELGREERKSRGIAMALALRSFLLPCFLASFLLFPVEPVPLVWPDANGQALTLAFVGDVMLGRGVAQALDGDWEAAFAEVQPWLSEAGRVSFYRQFAQADERYTAEVEPFFGQIRCSVRIIWGEDDPWIPLARGEALQSLIPSASFERLADVGHLPQLEAPDRVLDQIVKFMSQNDTP